jgi:predicted methyltransferase
MYRRGLILALAALSLSSSNLALAAVPSPLAKALADSARPASDVARDEARHPAEMLSFAGIKPGDRVADFMMGSGYFTRILAKAVGDKGQVYGYQSAEFIKFRAAYGTDQAAVAADYKNVTPLAAPLSAAGLPEGLDLVLTVQNYHDMHLKAFPAETAGLVNQQVFKALKPGGIYLVVDHAAVAGAPLSVADRLHRIDAAIVRQEVEAAGFKLVGEDKTLASSADDHSLNVFLPAIRGKTDQFILKFQKPR